LYIITVCVKSPYIKVVSLDWTPCSVSCGPSLTPTVYLHDNVQSYLSLPAVYINSLGISEVSADQGRCDM